MKAAFGVDLILLLMAISIAVAQFPATFFPPCVNPNNTPGVCMPLRDCTPLFGLVTSQPPLKQSDVSFLRASRCNSIYIEEVHVCCTTETEFVPRFGPAAPFDGDAFWDGSRGLGNYQRNAFVFPEAKSNQNQNQNQNINWFEEQSLLPKPPICGGVKIENKIYGGRDASLNEFPWLALLEYQKKNYQISFSCSGSLINRRYVLTAAHCVTGVITKHVGPLVAVRLGEHDLSQDVDCDLRSCNPEVIRATPSEILFYNGYNEQSSNKEHDIALLRLERAVRFSSSISPICLPSAMPNGLTPSSQTQFTVAGWGQTLRSPRSQIKRKLKIPFVKQQQCVQKFSTIGVQIVDTQICAGGQYAEDSCTGDSGGALMNFRNGAWVLEGIVSFGNKCGLRNWPAVHTRVASYDHWIREQIKP